MHDAPRLDMPSCWECETLTGDLIKAILPVSDHRVIRVQLCAACYRDAYLALVVDTEDAQLPTTR